MQKNLHKKELFLANKRRRKRKEIITQKEKPSDKDKIFKKEEVQLSNDHEETNKGQAPRKKRRKKIRKRGRKTR